MARRSVLRQFDLLVFGAVATSAVLSASTSFAQGGAPQQQAPQNLKFFPKDISRDSLLTVMRGFTYALGVNCGYCHVEEPGANGRPQVRPALDGKIEKEKARFMLAMVDTINRVTLAALPQRHAEVRVNCVTCHRGSPIPGTIETVLSDAIDKFGPDSAIARYRKLRETMATGRYDFSEIPVNGLARSLATQGKTDVAIALLMMNQEFNPNSAEIDFQLGDLYEKAGDKDKAITRFQAVLTKRPNDQRARARLTALGKPPA